MGNYNGVQGPWMVVEDDYADVVKIVEEDGYDPGFYTEICEVGQGVAEANLIAAAPDLLEALMKAKQVICSLKLSMLAHPDCTDGSEFDDITTSAQEAEDMASVVISKALGEEADNG